MQLLTIDDIAALFKVKRRTVAEQWIQRPDFPAPKYAPTRKSRLWEAADVDRWASPGAAQSAAGSEYSPDSSARMRNG
jgi:hypothetical protein